MSTQKQLYILCLVRDNAHKDIKNDSDLMYSCRKDNAVIFKQHVRSCQMDTLEFYMMRNEHTCTYN